MYTYEHICNSLSVVNTQASMCLCSKCFPIFLYVHTKYVVYISNVTKCHKNTPQWTLWYTTQIPPLGLKDLLPQLQRSCLALTQLKGVTWLKVIFPSQSSPYPQNCLTQVSKSSPPPPSLGQFWMAMAASKFPVGLAEVLVETALQPNPAFVLSLPWVASGKELPINLLANLHLIPFLGSVTHPFCKECPNKRGTGYA